MIVVDKLCYTSKLRYVNAMEKFVFAMLTLMFCLVSRSIVIAAIVLLITGFLTVWKGGISFPCYLNLMAAPLVFLFLSTAAILINVSSTPLDAFAFPLGSYYITGSYEGLLRGIRLIFTALSSVSCLYFLSLNTPLPDILAVLQILHVPQLFLELMLLTYRYIFVMLDRASAITTAQKSRLGTMTLASARKSFASMISAVFILSVRRSGALYDAMESRCYNGSIHVLSEERPVRLFEIVLIAGFELFLAFLTFVLWKWK